MERDSYFLWYIYISIYVPFPRKRGSHISLPTVNAMNSFFPFSRHIDGWLVDFFYHFDLFTFFRVQDECIYFCILNINNIYLYKVVQNIKQRVNTFILGIVIYIYI